MSVAGKKILHHIAKNNEKRGKKTDRQTNKLMLYYVNDVENKAALGPLTQDIFSKVPVRQSIMSKLQKNRYQEISIMEETRIKGNL